ncbi:Uma2 family endonuclease [soil metagenome]|jgi:Uma2 family endonuclease
MTTRPSTVTAEDLLEMPDDGFCYELLRGELKKMALAGFEHGSIAMAIGTSLTNPVKSKGLGVVTAAETGFKLASEPDTVRAPDVGFVRRERLEEVKEVKGYWPGAPDVAVEVTSPGDAHSKVMEKALEWLAAGTRMVLVVDLGQRTVSVYRSLRDIHVLTENDAIDGGDVVPGWTMRLEDVFA